MKKILSVFLVFLLVFSLCACTVSQSSTAEPTKSENTAPLKLGLICLHDENSTYDLNFINAFTTACQAANVEYMIKTGVGESNEAYEAAGELADAGCNLVFADSFGHEDYLIQAALEFPNVQFCHATGTKAHIENIPNFHNAFAAIYEGRYLAGVAAGLKLQERIENENVLPKVGYVGAYSYAEVISGYTAFFLGVRSIVPEATMVVSFTGSWYDETAEKEAAITLMKEGCAVISAHADSMGMPTACESNGIPFVAYNGSFKEACPNTYIVSTRINWVPYIEYLINCMKTNAPIAADWTGTIALGSVEMCEINNDVAAKDTDLILTKLSKDFMDGKLKVFDTNTFTLDGEKLTTYMADVDTDDNYTPDTEAIADGYFHESQYRSAPYFDINIDGITLLNTAF